MSFEVGFKCLCKPVRHFYRALRVSKCFDKVLVFSKGVEWVAD